ncbi:hypothetical protein B0H13DRAFT_2290216 [Mycena leptocephala]|nr:hypothetical protein B0H13DRAFT_2290216 [Mycena leptocephala]
MPHDALALGGYACGVPAGRAALLPVLASNSMYVLGVVGRKFSSTSLACGSPFGLDTRLVKPSHEGRTYHAFHQLVAGATMNTTSSNSKHTPTVLSLLASTNITFTSPTIMPSPSPPTSPPPAMQALQISAHRLDISAKDLETAPTTRHKATRVAELVRTRLGSAARCLHLELERAHRGGRGDPEGGRDEAREGGRGKRAKGMLGSASSRGSTRCRLGWAGRGALYTAALVENGILKPGHHPVAQLETGEGKEELNKRLRIVVKRVDHIERAYHKEQRPLFVQDYDQQQATDRETFAASQTECKEATKKRPAPMMPDYEARRAVVLAKKGEEYAKKNDVSSGKIEEENAKRKKAVLAKHEEELKASRRPSGKSRRESRRSADSKRNALQKKTAPTHRPISAWQGEPSATANTTVIALLDAARLGLQGVPLSERAIGTSKKPKDGEAPRGILPVLGCASLALKTGKDGERDRNEEPLVELAHGGQGGATIRSGWRNRTGVRVGDFR